MLIAILFHQYTMASNNQYRFTPRGERVNRVSPANTLKNEKQKVLSCLCDSVVLHTVEHDTTGQIKCIVSQLQPTKLSPRGQASTSWLRKPGWLQLANDAFYLIGSAVFLRVECH
jgi:hypothetical protein